MSPERQATGSLPGPGHLPVLETETRPSAPGALCSRISVIRVLVYFIPSSPVVWILERNDFPFTHIQIQEKEEGRKGGGGWRRDTEG